MLCHIRLLFISLLSKLIYDDLRLKTIYVPQKTATVLFIPTQGPQMIYLPLVSPATIHSPMQHHAIEGSDDMAPTYLVSIICQNYSLTPVWLPYKKIMQPQYLHPTEQSFTLWILDPITSLHLGFPSNYLSFVKSEVQLWSFYKHLLFLFTPSLTEHLNESKICHKTNEWILQSRNRLTHKKNKLVITSGEREEGRDNIG